MSFKSVILCCCFVIVLFCSVFSEDVVIRKSELACQRYQHLRENFHKENPKCSGPHNLISRYSDINEFPHMVAIGYNSEKDNTSCVFLCSGSLISAKFVLTAARCLKITNQVPRIVRLGKVNKAQIFNKKIKLLKIYLSDNTPWKRLQRSY